MTSVKRAIWAEPRLKTASEIKRMRQAGIIAYEALKAMVDRIRPGVTGKELDQEGNRIIQRKGGRACFKGYRGYPAATCIAINDVVVHGIPNDRPIAAGDIVGIDLGVFYNGVFVDTGVTVGVAPISPIAGKLLKVTSAALYLAIEKAVAGNTVWDISSTIEQWVLGNGLQVVRDLVGHGIGHRLHEPPEVPNFATERLKDYKLQPGMTLAIEPMVTTGDYRVKILSDGWTVVTSDGSLAAQFEHTIAVTERDGAQILTLGPNDEDELWKGILV
ncbi:MAG: type I methionyl aminopeptidase [Armatimonadetes bacterium]|nr:type I methionyl aminopeptidase [Armatimonadota bacterium]MDW8121181.1 type I methionyl aminopeptidase [Armatimonadota bacterium]